MRKLLACAGIACLIGIAASAASAAEGFRSVYHIGQKAPGLDAVIAANSNAILGPNGEVGFVAPLVGPGVSPPDGFGNPTAFGSFLFNANGLTTLTYTGAAISGVDPSRRVEGSGPPQFSQTGYVTYDVTINNLQTLRDRDFGVWDLSGPLLIGGQNGVPRFDQMYSLSQNSRSLFYVSYVGSGGQLPGIWEKRANGVFPLVTNFMTVPGLPPDSYIGSIRYDATTRDGNIIFGATIYPPGFNSGIFALEGSTIVPLSVTGDRIGPDGPFVDTYIPLSLLNSHDQLAIMGNVVDEGTSKSAIWLREPDGTQRMIARAGEIPPGGTHPFPYVLLGGFNDDGKVLVATDGYWLYGLDGSKQAVITVGDNAPGIQGAHFVERGGGWLNNRGSIVVHAFISGEGITEQNNQAMWFIDPDTQAWKLLLRSGQTLDTADGQLHVVRDFFAGPLNDADQVAVFVNFTDGGGAMYRIDAREVPEPASLSLIGAVALMLAGRRRR